MTLHLYLNSITLLFLLHAYSTFGGTVLEANVGDLFLYKPEPATGGTRGARGLRYFTDLVEVKPFHSKDLLLLPLAHPMRNTFRRHNKPSCCISACSTHEGGIHICLWKNLDFVSIYWMFVQKIITGQKRFSFQCTTIVRYVRNDIFFKLKNCIKWVRILSFWLKKVDVFCYRVFFISARC